MKKLLKLMLSVMLVLSLVTGLVGCQGSGDVEKDTASSTEVKETDSKETESTTETKETEEEEEAEELEHMEISIGHWNADFINDAGDDDTVLKLLEDKFNVTFEGKGVSWSDYKQKFNLWAAADELPDIFAVDEINSNTYTSWIDQGIIKALPSDMSSYPNLKAIIDKPDVAPLNVDGTYYMIPRITHDNAKNWLTDRSLIIRKDWLEALGMDAPKNYEDFKTVVDAMMKADFDGNGVDDTVGITNFALYQLEALFMDLVPTAATGSWVQKDGQWQPAYYSEEMTSIIDRVRELYDTGLLDQDFVIMNSGDGAIKFAQGNVAVLSQKSSPGALKNLKVEWEKYENGVAFEDAVTIVPLWEHADGNTYGFTSTSYWSESYFNGNLTDEKMDRILQIYDYLLSDEFKEIKQYGFEGVDFTKSGDTYTTLIPEGESLKGRYGSLEVFAMIVIWEDGFQLERGTLNDNTYGKDVMSIAMDHFDVASDVMTTTPINFGIQLMKTPAKSNLGINYMDDVVRIAVSDMDSTEGWAEVLEGYRAQGIETAIQEVTDMATQMGIK